MIAFRSATIVANLFWMILFVCSSAKGAADTTRIIPAKFRWQTADVAWDTHARKAVTRAILELEIPEEGYPALGLAGTPTQVQWDGSAVHPSLLAEVPGKKGLRYLKVKIPAGTAHQLDVEFSAPLEKVAVLPVSAESMAIPLTVRFHEPKLIGGHDLQTNGLAQAAADGNWSVRFKDSSSGVYVGLPDGARFGKLIRWLIRLPFSLLGGGGEGPPPLILFKPHHH